MGRLKDRMIEQADNISINIAQVLTDLKRVRTELDEGCRVLAVCVSKWKNRDDDAWMKDFNEGATHIANARSALTTVEAIVQSKPLYFETGSATIKEPSK